MRSVATLLAVLLWGVPQVLLGAPRSWDDIGPGGGSGPQVVVPTGANSEVLFASTIYALRRSDDGGANWSELSEPAIKSVTPAVGQSNAVFGFGDSRVWLSVDSGRTWQITSIGQPPADYTGINDFVAVGPQPGVVYGTWAKLQMDGFGFPRPYGAAAARSTDGGRTWASIDAGLSGTSRSVFASQADLGLAYVRTSEGVFRTSDAGISWRKVFSSAERGFVAQIAVDQRDASRVYVVAQGAIVWVSEDGGETWRAGPVPSTTLGVGQLVADPRDAGRIFSLGYKGDIFESRDAARSWQRLAVGIDPDSGIQLSSMGIVARGASRAVIAADGATIVKRDVNAPQGMALGTDLWWNPAKSGWGLSLVQRDNLQMFAVWFTYDAQGEPIWRFVPGGTWIDANTFTGTLYSSKKAPGPFFGADVGAVTVTPVGSIVLRFSSQTQGEATFTVGPTVFREPIQRMSFGPVNPFQWPIADLWWSPAQSGWGLAIHQQYSTVFATLFVYDEEGEPTWLFMPEAATARGAMSGRIYRARNTPGAPYAVRSVTVSRAGDLAMDVNGGMVLHGTIDGKSWISFVSRLPF